MTSPSPLNPRPLSGNPYLDEIDSAVAQGHANLSPPAQEAVSRSGVAPALLGLVPPATQPAPAVAPLAAPRPAMRGLASTAPPELSGTAGPTSAAPLMPMAMDRPMPPAQPLLSARPLSQLSPTETEYNRLHHVMTPAELAQGGPHTHLNTGASGLEQIHSPWARVPLEILNAIGTGFAPRLTSAIPGTPLHHQAVAAENEDALKTEQGVANEEQRRGLEGAQTANQEAAPELKRTQQELAATKQQQTQELNERKLAETTQHHASTLAQQLAQHGFEQDEEGNINSLSYDKMSEDQKAVHDLKASQTELANATAELRRAQKENQPKAAELAQQRIANAQRNSQIAAGRLGLQQQEFERDTFGTNKGEPIPGAPADAGGQPLGFKSPAGHVNAAAAGRGAQAGVIQKTGEDLKKLADENKDVFGNLGSYWKQATSGTPISDPKAAKVMAAITSYAALNPAAHGFRSTEALKLFEKTIGGIPNNLESFKAAIDGISGTMGRLQEGGTSRTVQRPGTATPTPGQGTPPSRAYLNGKPIVVKSGKWVYEDTGEEAK
jgi:hypothetical protein